MAGPERADFSRAPVWGAGYVNARPPVCPRATISAVPVVRRPATEVSSLDVLAARVRMVGRHARTGSIPELRDSLRELSSVAMIVASQPDPLPPTLVQRRQQLAAERDRR
jgi:hypothetical protein